MRVRGSPQGFPAVSTTNRSEGGIVGSPTPQVSKMLTVTAGAGGGITPPIRFSAPTAVLGVSPTDKAYTGRTLSGASMRVASAPEGADLVVNVQHWNGFSWQTLGTLNIGAGSVTEATSSFAQPQGTGDMVRVQVTSVGSTAAATGVVVDVLVG